MLFLNSSTLFFCANIVYWASNIFVYLINLLNLFIKKQISNKVKILTYFKEFLGYLQFYLINTKKIKKS